ncbi:hypothetical protein QTP86_002986 [Hemibagrus guttatus]|nr:hypothetical protein QTP86_002986 [Hemibagrus guttatus]
MMERRKVDILCVQETRWKGSKARSIGAGFKLFYYGVDGKRNGVGVVLKEEFVRNVLEVGCELEEKERFWSELDEVMESIPTGERVVIGADFNGHVGEGNRGDEEVMGKFGVKERNLEGQMVVDFAKRMDMAVVNTYFQKREEHRVTYKSGARQHRMVVCRMTLMKLRQALGGQVVLPDDWETTAEVIRETGRKDSIQRKKLAKKKWDMDRTEENRQEYKELQRRLKREVSKAKQKAYDELYTRVLTSEESVQRRWKEYFEELMNEENEREKRVEGVNSVEQKVDKIRKDEVRKALKRMKSGKAVGPYDIPVEYRDGQRELHCLFVDLEKAYDRVPIEELWYCMRKSGVAEKYVRVVQDMYERSRTVVRCAVVMDQLSEEVRQESPWTMMFADDIVICSESREQVEENLERWRFALERKGMKVSRSKTEYMCVNEREGSGTVRLQGEEVKKVQEFKYLGSTVQSNGECGKEVKKRVQAGWNGWRKVSGVLCDQKISARIKEKVYRTVVRPAMLYGLETVSLRKRQESELEVAELKMLRFSLGVTRLDRIRNEYIRGTAHVGRLGDKVREARLRWFGHVQRRESEYIGRRMLDMELPAKLRRLRSEKEAAFRSGDREKYKEAKYRFSEEVIRAKTEHGERMQQQFQTNDSASVWKGLKAITNYKPRAPHSVNDVRLANSLNEYYCCFERQWNSPDPPQSSPYQLLISSSSSSYTSIPVSPTQLHTLATPHPPPLTPLTIKEEEVNRLFKRLNTRKATGLDSVSPSLLKHCANQLSPVFTDIFNTSLETSHVPACFKTSAIVPVPKKTKITGFNDYRPVALTSVVMKSFERLVLSYLKDITDPLLDPLQFAYRANRSVDDAVNMALHFILQHLDSPGSYARILFVDFSFAFNMIIPALLRDKLFQLNVPDSMCSWITNFLTDRRQFVRLGTHVSDFQHMSTGSPQGCVLSPLLFSLYTNGCTSGHQSVKLLKFADDTTLIGLISDGDESAYRGEIDRLVSWCSTNNLELNSLKTVEMTVDFRKNPAPRPPVILCDSPVSSAESFCFLGTTITKELKWEQNIRSLTKKAQQRMYFLRQLKKILLPVKMLVNFYTAIIESVLTSSITVWFAAATARDKAKLQRVIHSAEKVIGCSLPSLQELYVSRSRRRAAKIAADPSHPGNELFRSLPSGKRLRSIRTRTSCHKNSFFPTAVSLLNSAPLTPR